MPDMTLLRFVRVFMPDANSVNDWRMAFILGVNNAETKDCQLAYYVPQTGWQEVGATFDDASDPPISWTWRDL